MVSILVIDNRTHEVTQEGATLDVLGGDSVTISASGLIPGQHVDFQASTNNADPWITFQSAIADSNGVCTAIFTVDATRLPFYVHARIA